MITFFLLALLPVFTIAAPAPPSACPDASLVKAEIKNCGMNPKALFRAQACSKALLAEAKTKTTALQAELAPLGKSLTSAQKSLLASARDRYDRMLQEVTPLILALQATTKTVAEYPQAMIDVYDGVDDTTSLDCFREPFHALQSLVDNLDQQTAGAVDARQAVESMYRTLFGNEQNLNISQVTKTADPKAGAAQMASRPTPTQSAELTSNPTPTQTSTPTPAVTPTPSPTGLRGTMDDALAPRAFHPLDSLPPEGN